MRSLFLVSVRLSVCLCLSRFHYTSSGRLFFSIIDQWSVNLWSNFSSIPIKRMNYYIGGGLGAKRLFAFSHVFFICFFHFTFYFQSINHSIFHIFCPIHSRATTPAHLPMECWVHMHPARLICGQVLLRHHLTTIWRHPGGLTSAISLIIAPKHILICMR